MVLKPHFLRSAPPITQVINECSKLNEYCELHFYENPRYEYQHRKIDGKVSCVGIVLLGGPGISPSFRTEKMLGDSPRDAAQYAAADLLRQMDADLSQLCA